MSGAHSISTRRAYRRAARLPRVGAAAVERVRPASGAGDLRARPSPRAGRRGLQTRSW